MVIQVLAREEETWCISKVIRRLPITRVSTPVMEYKNTGTPLALVFVSFNH